MEQQENLNENLHHCGLVEFGKSGVRDRKRQPAAVDFPAPVNSFHVST